MSRSTLLIFFFEFFNLDSTGGCGPIAFDPSQKQSIGVIKTHGTIRSTTAAKLFANELSSISGLGGLKHISDNVQLLKNLVLSFTKVEHSLVGNIKNSYTPPLVTLYFAISSIKATCSSKSF